MNEPFAALESKDQALLEFNDAISLMVACAAAYRGGRPLKLGAPCACSGLSRQAAYRYRRTGITLEPNADEPQHLVLNALTPSEVERLRARHGLMEELGAQLYATETHVALAPKVRVPTEVER